MGEKTILKINNGWMGIFYNLSICCEIIFWNAWKQFEFLSKKKKYGRKAIPHTVEPSNSPFILESNTFDIPLILTWFEKEKPHAIIKCMVNWVKECTCYRHIRLSCVSKHSLLIKNAFHDFRAIGQ